MGTDRILRQTVWIVHGSYSSSHRSPTSSPTESTPVDTSSSSFHPRPPHPSIFQDIRNSPSTSFSVTCHGGYGDGHRERWSTRIGLGSTEGLLDDGGNGGVDQGSKTFPVAEPDFGGQATKEGDPTHLSGCRGSNDSSPPGLAPGRRGVSRDVVRTPGSLRPGERRRFSDFYSTLSSPSTHVSSRQEEGGPSRRRGKGVGASSVTPTPSQL